MQLDQYDSNQAALKLPFVTQIKESPICQLVHSMALCGWSLIITEGGLLKSRVRLARHRQPVNPLYPWPGILHHLPTIYECHVQGWGP